MNSIIFAMPGNGAMTQEIARLSGAQLGALETRSFPDGESYVRLQTDVMGKDCAIVCTLARPDAQIMPLILAAGALREWGASHVRLIAPYLAYLRQDAHFHEGEALSAKHFARLISASFDSLVTVDPHLHRIKTLSALYTIPAEAIAAAPVIGAWVAAHVPNPFLIGPDSESRQWAASAAAAANAGYLVLDKTRLSDTEVGLAWPDLSGFEGKTPVLIDDIAASGRTLIAAAQGLAARGFAKPVCAIVHALLDEDAFATLQKVCARVVSTDSVRHVSNAMNLAPLIAAV